MAPLSEWVEFDCFHGADMLCCSPVLDDDSSKLPEILELFTGSKLPLKVDKLIKVCGLLHLRLYNSTNIPVYLSHTALGEQWLEGQGGADHTH